MFQISKERFEQLNVKFNGQQAHEIKSHCATTKVFALSGEYYDKSSVRTDTAGHQAYFVSLKYEEE